MRRRSAVSTWPTVKVTDTTTGKRPSVGLSTLTHSAQERGTSSSIADDPGTVIEDDTACFTKLDADPSEHTSISSTQEMNDYDPSLPPGTDIDARQQNHGNGQEDDQSTRASADEHDALEVRSNGATFVAIDPPSGYPKLDFRPTILRPYATIAICGTYIGLAVGLSLLAILPSAKIVHSIKRDEYYLAIRYGPGLVAAMSTFLFRSVAQEYMRMLPYINMADSGTRSGARYTISARYWPLLSNANTPGTLATSLLLRTSGILIAYKALLFDVVNKGNLWEMRVHTGSAVPLVCYYAIMALYMLVLTVRMWSKSTGLRSDWDPQCLADIISLFAYFNLDLDNESSSQGDLLPPSINDSCHNSNYRLGYWLRRDETSTCVVYGIRMVSAAEKRYDGRMESESKVVLEVRRKGFHQYLLDPWISPAYWTCIVILVTWLGLMSLLFGNGVAKHDFALSKDWSLHRTDHLTNDTLSTTATNITLAGRPGLAGLPIGGHMTPRSIHLFWANFVLRFLPIVTLNIVAVQMTVQDSYHRFWQPMYDISRNPKLAKDCLLRYYLTKNPFAVTSEAFQNRQWKVFIYSLLGSAPQFLMIVPYGILTLVDNGTVIFCKFSKAALAGTCALIVVWLGALLSSWPTERRRVPRPEMSLIDIWSLFHNSHIAKEDCFACCGQHWTKQHLHGAVINLSNQYALGICHGEDGRKRIGVDIYSCGPQGESKEWVQVVRPRHMRRWLNKPGGANSATTGNEEGLERYEMARLVLQRENDRGSTT
jgi:hypothetical protein